MKSLLAAIMFMAIGLSSCEKCYECTTTITTTVNQSVPGYPQTSTTKSEYCGKDVESVEGTQTSSSSSGGITATSKSVTKCTKK